jgi:hypothetical protein
MCLVEIAVLITGSVTGSVEAQCNLVASLCWSVMTYEGRRLSDIAYRPFKPKYHVLVT